MSICLFHVHDDPKALNILVSFERDAIVILSSIMRTKRQGLLEIGFMDYGERITLFHAMKARRRYINR